VDIQADDQKCKGLKTFISLCLMLRQYVFEIIMDLMIKVQWFVLNI
jgi:hypothetical protein